MITSRCLFRLDDITETMDWRQFDTLMGLFSRFGVKPLLGIVPKNEDPALSFDEANPRFWGKMRELRTQDLAEFAQHGYTHVLTNPGSSIDQGLHQRKSDKTEFVGKPFEEQLRRIRAGREILMDEGIDTSWWIAPRHSYDLNTLRALKLAGFTAVSDGISLFPYKEEGLIFVPQQFWRTKWAKWLPIGSITICIHPGTVSRTEFVMLEDFLSSAPPIASFSDEVERVRQTPLQRAFLRFVCDCISTAQRNPGTPCFKQNQGA